MKPASESNPAGASPHALIERLLQLDAADPRYAVDAVDLLLMAARDRGASDVHLRPTAAGLELHWRIDGVLLPLGCLPAATAPNIVARLKVLAHLLTYRNDVPQEGRIQGAAGPELRVSTFPTLHGEKAVVRLFAAAGPLAQLDELGLPDDIRQTIAQLLAETTGMLLVTGPAGSGKTTTLYACLRRIVEESRAGRSVATLEDPIEQEVAGVAQSQINPATGFDFAAGLRSLVRQDPEVILIGEIRDRETAGIAFQAALTGQLVLSSFHAGSAAEAVTRLSDMGIEPYLLRAGLLSIVCQRLMRRLCKCAMPIASEKEKLGLQVTIARRAVGCEACGGTGYGGRMLLAELLAPGRGNVGQAILAGADAANVERLARAAGMTTRWERAAAAVNAGQTSPAEVRRVLGFSIP